MKLFSKSLCSKEHIKRIYYEIEIMKTFDHPGIVKVHEWFEDKQRIYIVMELLGGGDLHTRIIYRKN
jgi:serine/threonine protein kinase